MSFSLFFYRVLHHQCNRLALDDEETRRVDERTLRKSLSYLSTSICCGSTILYIVAFIHSPREYIIILLTVSLVLAALRSQRRGHVPLDTYCVAWLRGLRMQGDRSECHISFVAAGRRTASLMPDSISHITIHMVMLHRLRRQRGRSGYGISLRHITHGCITGRHRRPHTTRSRLASPYHTRLLCCTQLHYRWAPQVACPMVTIHINLSPKATVYMTGSSG